MPTKKEKQKLARKKRIRRKLSGTPDRPRLSVFRSQKQIYAQVIDDTTGMTLVSCSSLEKDLKDEIEAIRSSKPVVEESAAEEGKKKKKKGKPKPPVSKNLLIAGKIGETLAGRCKEKQIDKVAFDRSGFKYHGRVKSLADAARKAGLSF